ncbi:MAG: ribosome biosis GTPase / thiamine phosphate phosphatase [Acidimicrobiaceae bacterium]|nr:ribosome biosis GTPase / thiamine phosphate phosphatase [Acidimicrobiaceae bacterium]
MHDVNLGALLSLGWDARARALFTELARPELFPGRVVRVERSACVVALADGDHMAAAPIPVAVGDWAAVGIVDGAYTVTGVTDRWSQLTRGDPSGGVQVLAANIDLVLITAPADRLSPARIERETALAWDSGAQPVVLVTKADLAVDGEIDRLEARLAVVDVVATSVVTSTGLDRVRDRLRPCRTAVLIGPSGAGKSSLTNALVGEARMVTGSVRDGDHRGRHTTTTRQLVPVPDGGVLIDTPGLRSLALAGDGTGVQSAFSDIEELAAGCRFGDCRHEREPGCAVLAAAARGQLDQARLASYGKLRKEVAWEERRHDPRARQASLRQWKAVTRSVRSQPKKR